MRLEGKPLAKEFLRVRLLDQRRRELARKDLQTANGSVKKDLQTAHASVKFDFKIQRWMPKLITVEAQLCDKQGEVSRAYRYFHVTKRNRGRFNFLIWDVPIGTLAPYAEENLGELA